MIPQVLGVCANLPVYLLQELVIVLPGRLGGCDGVGDTVKETKTTKIKLLRIFHERDGRGCNALQSLLIICI